MSSLGKNCVVLQINPPAAHAEEETGVGIAVCKSEGLADVKHWLPMKSAELG